MRALLVKVGDAHGVLMPDMEIPQASNTSEQPEVVVERALTTTTNGATAQVPLSVTSPSSAAIASLFFKVGGSADLISVDLSDPVAAAAPAEQRAAFATQNLSKALVDGMANLELAIPPNISAGTFTVEVAVQDENGLVSSSKTGSIQIARVGTGTLQFSLSWDAFVDLDLEVTDPNGDNISFRSPDSPSGGELDRDDTSGGPGAIENIFWETSAPNGLYAVDVNYFSGSEAANFVLTVSINGSVIDSISRANFNANDGRLPVYDLSFGGTAANSTGVAFPDRSPGSGENSPSAVLARLQGTWEACYLDGNGSELESLTIDGDRAELTFLLFAGSSDCTGSSTAGGGETLDFVIGDPVQTTGGQLANEVDITVVSSDEFPTGSVYYNIVFVDDTLLAFGLGDLGGTTPAERPTTLDLEEAFSRVTQ